MEPEKYILHSLSPGAPLPFELLLMADESREAIGKYVPHSDVYIVSTKGHHTPIGVFVLYKISDTMIELKNIAVLESFQRKGLGSYMIGKIKTIARRENIQEIIVSTPENGTKEIRFYEKNGFTKFDVRKNYVKENYSKPIAENGVIIKVMLLLKINPDDSKNENNSKSKKI